MTENIVTQSMACHDFQLGWGWNVGCGFCLLLVRILYICYIPETKGKNAVFFWGSAEEQRMLSDILSPSVEKSLHQATFHAYSISFHFSCGSWILIHQGQPLTGYSFFKHSSSHANFRVVKALGYFSPRWKLIFLFKQTEEILFRLYVTLSVFVKGYYL